jgi:hypothetical protein
MLRWEGKKKVPQRSYRPQIEALEERRLLSTDTWTGNGGANGNWSNSANWDNGVPNPGDDLVFITTFNTTPPAIDDLAPGTTFHSMTFNQGQGFYDMNGVFHAPPQLANFRRQLGRSDRRDRIKSIIPNS